MSPDIFGATTKEGLSSLIVFAIKIRDFYLYKGFLCPMITLFLDTKYLLLIWFGIRPKSCCWLCVFSFFAPCPTPGILLLHFKVLTRNESLFC